MKNNNLPDVCLTTLSTDRNQVVAIVNGETGYYPQERFQVKEDAEIFASEYNKKRSITAAQVKAMEVGSMFGWDVPGANPTLYEHIK